MDEKEVLKENTKTWAKLDEVCKELQSKMSEIRKQHQVSNQILCKIYKT